MTERREEINFLAEEKFGKERTEQLQGDLEQLASDIERLLEVALEIDDEP
jgi:hypothetical protein